MRRGRKPGFWNAESPSKRAGRGIGRGKPETRPTDPFGSGRLKAWTSIYPDLLLPRNGILNGTRLLKINIFAIFRVSRGSQAIEPFRYAAFHGASPKSNSAWTNRRFGFAARFSWGPRYYSVQFLIQKDRFYCEFYQLHVSNHLNRFRVDSEARIVSVCQIERHEMTRAVTR